eukprot:8828695-Pyramimonas_sp.AAC.1
MRVLRYIDGRARATHQRQRRRQLAQLALQLALPPRQLSGALPELGQRLRPHRPLRSLSVSPPDPRRPQAPDYGD